MFNANLTALDLIALGEDVVVLRNPNVWNAQNYVSNRTAFLQRLPHIGFDNTNAAAKRLADYRVHEVVGRSSIHPTDSAALEQIARTVYAVLSHEASQLTLIATDHVPPAELVNLEAKLGRQLEPHQKALQRDAITCLKAHLARPAIVMAWALGYDIVRWWVHSDGPRLAAFNAQYKPSTIDKYEDLFDVGERTFLDTCKNARNALKDFNENTHHALVHSLNERNRFAHANFSEATVNRANAFVEKVVETVTGPPFV
jgi:hypothetical protein